MIYFEIVHVNTHFTDIIQKIIFVYIAVFCIRYCYFYHHVWKIQNYCTESELTLSQNKQGSNI